MSEPLQEYRQQASYRRGTVMGLTAAETFMLVAFILLTLLVFWRVMAAEERERLLEENSRLTEAVENVGGLASITNALAFQDRFDQLPADEMEARLDLMENDTLRALAREAQDLPEEGLLELTDLTRDGDIPGVREKLNQLERLGLRPEEVAELQQELAAAQEKQRRLEEKMTRVEEARGNLETEKKALEERLTAFDETGQTPSDIRKMEATLADFGAQQQSLVRTGAEIAATIEEKAGGRIAALGGQVLPDGDVIFPDAILFEANSAEIQKDFDTLLQSFCRLWFETLYEQRDALDTMQVEGHASSEFGPLSPEKAFVRNLDLSQRRAAAVFVRCLAYSGDDEITDWARSSMAAVGYSSSRAILEDGVENRAASRRVVFALEPKTEAQMTRRIIDQSPVEVPPTLVPDADGSARLPDGYGPDHYRKLGYERLAGPVTAVRDGDTIEVAGQPIRIEGLHAPETDTEAGRETARFVTAMLSGRPVTCFLSGEETFDRKVGVCFENGEDIAARIIMAGLGRDCPAFSGGRYAQLETASVKALGELPGYC
ncbi:MAG: hypothetical protein RI571_10815 [Roseovarius sp.]|nr:hypothetical protein [Roseovarius sp.]